MKKLLACMMIMSLALLSACGSSQAPATEQTTEAPAETTAAPSAEETEKPEETEAVEFKEGKSAELMKSISVIGIVDMDGSKPAALAIEYDADLTGADIDVDTFEIEDYGLTLEDKDLDTGSDAGKAVKAYVNDKADIDENGGSGSGNFVIIEVNTAYSVGRYTRSWLATMAAGATQVKDIEGDNCKITASDAKVINYHEFEYIGIDPMNGGFRDPEYYNYADEGTYTIKGIEGYELHMIASDAELYEGTDVEVKEPFHAEH